MSNLIQISLRPFVCSTTNQLTISCPRPHRLWDKLSQTLQRSGGNRVFEETQEHERLLPVHPGPRLKDQG